MAGFRNYGRVGTFIIRLSKATSPITVELRSAWRARKTDIEVEAIAASAEMLIWLVKNPLRPLWPQVSEFIVGADFHFEAQVPSPAFHSKQILSRFPSIQLDRFHFQQPK